MHGLVTIEEEKSREDKGLKGKRLGGIELKDKGNEEEVRVPYCGLLTGNIHKTRRFS